MRFAGVVALCAALIIGVLLFNAVVLACPGLVWGYVLLCSLAAWWVQALIRKVG